MTAARHFDDARRTAAALSRDGSTFEPLRRIGWEHGAARAHFGRGDLVAAEDRVRDALSMIGIALPRARTGWAALAAGQLVALALGNATRADPDRVVLKELSSAASLLPHRYFYDEDMLRVVGASLLSANLARRARARAAVGPLSHLAAMAGLFRLSRIAQRLFDEAYDSAVVERDWGPASQALLLEAFYHGGMGDFRAAERAATRAAEVCGRTSDPWMLENVETTFSHIEFFTGRFAAARARAVRVTELARERRNTQHEIWGLYLQARSDIPRKQFASARPLLEQALQRLQGQSEIISEIACQGMLAEACLGDGDLQRAEVLALSLVEFAARQLPSAYPTLVGYTGAARVLRHLVEYSYTPARMTAARTLATALWRFALVFPIAKPSAYLHLAHLLRVRGFRRAAHQVFQRGVRHAIASQMPYERALLLDGAASTMSRADLASGLRSSARVILDELGVPAV